MLQEEKFKIKFIQNFNPIKNLLKFISMLTIKAIGVVKASNSNQ
jgi:hypothetical protein